MNTLQVIRQIRYRLKTRRWAGNPAYERVFQPAVTAGATEEALRDLRFPFALISALGGPSDPEEPGITLESIRIVICQAVEDDDVGQRVVIGGPRSAGVSSSKGRGLLELEAELKAAIKILSTKDGIEIFAKVSNSTPAIKIPNIGSCASRDYLFEARVQDQAYYHPPTRLLATAPGSGNVSLTWELPPDRYDRRSMILRRAAGATAPTSPSSGTSIALSADLATSKVDTPGAGQFSYALFAAYLEMTDTEPPTAGTPDNYSAAATVTVTAT